MNFPHKTISNISLFKNRSDSFFYSFVKQAKKNALGCKNAEFIKKRQKSEEKNSARLTYVSVYDSRDGVSEPAPSPSSPSSITRAHSIQSHTLLTPTLLTFMCTQVLWCLACLTRPRVSGVTMTSNTRRTIFSTRGTQCM